MAKCEYCSQVHTDEPCTCGHRHLHERCKTTDAVGNTCDCILHMTKEQVDMEKDYIETYGLYNFTSKKYCRWKE